MNLSPDILKNKILEYLANEITKNEIASWAYNTMYTLLGGEVFELEKLSVWQFVTMITQVNNCLEPCSEHDVRQIASVLNGNENSTYILHMKIPERFSDPRIKAVQNLLEKKLLHISLTKAEIVILEQFSKRLYAQKKTVQDLLESQISALLSSGYTFFSKDSEMIFRISHSIYMDDSDMTEHRFLEKLIHLLNCCTGLETFALCITYVRGVSNISLAL